MGEEDSFNWEELSEGMLNGGEEKPTRSRKKKSGRQPRQGPKEQKHYRAAYNTSKLEKLLAARGQQTARNIALQRGRTLLTKKRGDEQRAQVSTAKNFDGIDILDNMIPYDKNLIIEPPMRSMAAQFGNFQEQMVENDMAGHPTLPVTYRPCPL